MFHIRVNSILVFRNFLRTKRKANEYSNETLTRVRRWCACWPGYDRLHLLAPKTLDVREHRQQNKYPDDNEHYGDRAIRDSRSAGLQRLSGIYPGGWKPPSQRPALRQSRGSAAIARRPRSVSRAYRFFPGGERSSAENKIGSPTTIVIGANRKLPPSRCKASWAPKIRIGTTGARVFAMIRPNPGSAGCKLPSRVREPSGKSSTAWPAFSTRITVLIAPRSTPS